MKRFVKAAFPVFLVLALNTESAVVYKYMDMEGNVGYGEQLPEGAMLLEELEIADTAGVDSLAASNALIDQLAKTADRLKKDRQYRDSKRLEDQRSRAAAQQSQLPPVVYREDHYYPYYPRVRSRYPYYRNDDRSGRRPIDDFYRPAHRRGPDRDDRSRSGDQGTYNGPVLSPRSKVLTP